jgi:hypothetical protein
MRRIPRALSGVAVAALLAAGCASEADAPARPDPADKPPGTASGPAPESSPASNAPPSTPTMPTPTPSPAVRITGPQEGVAASGADMQDPPGRPPDDADFTAQVEYALQGDLLSDARVPGRTTAVCPHGVTQEARARSACTVTYEGVEIPYTVTIGESYEPGDVLTPYRAEPERRLLVATRVHHEFWDRFGGDAGTELSCDEIPAAVAVAEGEPTGYTCRTVRDSGLTSRYRVVADPSGPRFDRVEN